MNDYEVEFDDWNNISRKHDHKYDFFKASSEEDARAFAYWVYGDLIDIISITCIRLGDIR